MGRGRAGGLARAALGFVVAMAGACGDDAGRLAVDTDIATSSDGDDATVGPSDGSDSTTEATGGSESSAETGADDSTGTTGPEPDDPGDPWDPLPEYPPLTPEQVEGFKAVVDGILADPAVNNATQGVLIVDLQTEQVLYERAPDTVVVPASNTKMFTTAALVDLFGIDHSMTVTAHGASPDGAGTVAGDLFVVGEHDFTWSTFFYGSARFPADRLADRLWDAGVRAIGGDVIVGGEYLYEGYSLGYYDPPAERAQAATQLRDALLARGISVSGTAATTTSFDPPAGSSALALWSSIPIGQANVHINGPSHNEFSDIALRHIGWQQAGASDYAAGGGAMKEWLASIGTDTTEVFFNDGSGLSHGNRVSPRNLVDLCRFMTTAPGGLAWERSLAISGVRGTISSRMTGTATWGRVFAKTGTLPSIGVVTLSGYLFHRHDGRRYAFSILFNGAASVSGARGVQDLVVGALATDLRGVGEPPASPVLRAVTDDDGDDVVTVQWDPVADVDGYAVWLSPDGQLFDPADARYVVGTEYRAGQLAFGPDIHVRVTAVRMTDAGPVHSAASDVYAVRNSAEGSTILVVDGNDRWAAEPVVENPRRIGHDFVSVHGAAMPAGAGYDAATNEAVTDGSIVLDDYDIVVWVLGEESEADRTFDDDEQVLVEDYLAAGGRLMVSGAEIGWDLVELGTPADAAFFETVLGATYLGDDAGTPLATPATDGPWSDVGAIGFLTPADQIVSYPDLLGPGPGAQTLLEYRGGNAGAAAVSTGNVVLMGFPFESIDQPQQRAVVMERVLEQLGG